MKKIGFIGAGKMAEAIMTGLIDKAFTSAGSILASDISGDRLVDLSHRLGIRITLDNVEVVRQVGVVIVDTCINDEDYRLIVSSPGCVIPS
jgi:pyrroline-5-carboxylate reductase